MTDFKKDLLFMASALELAKEASRLGEVPVGAVVTFNNEIIGEGLNAPISTNDPSHHAEVAAIRQAAKSLSNYRLPGTTLYVTLEPCTMCFGLLVHARIRRVVYGADEPRAGVLTSKLQLPDETFYNHSIQIEGGLMADESKQLLQSFFKAQRAR